ncbi:MAG: hypothetical protein DCC49_05655 [Acidobacteria bacterium]|nr:MAG: hypothetical protein DCC49_05655 [Acidobacteriota bacterium]
MAIYNANLLNAISEIAPQDIQVEQLALADPAEMIPGWQIPASNLKYRRMPVMRLLAGIAGAIWRPSLDFIVAGRHGIYHALIATEALAIDPSRRLVSVHDASLFRDDIADEFSSETRVECRQTLESSAGVVTVSEFSRRELLEHLDLDESRIAVVPGGVDHMRFFPRSEEEVTAVRNRYGLPNRYVISVAGGIPRKRLGDVEAMADKLWKKDRIETVVVGSGRGSRPGAKRLGFVPREHLPALYTGAVAFISMSEYEGFGLAPLESVACGTPVIAARADAIVEVLGDVASFVEVGDVDGASKAVEKVTEKRARRKRVQAGLELAQNFRWEETAQKMLCVYRSMMSGEAISTASSQRIAAGLSIGDAVEAGESEVEAEPAK